MTFVVVVVVVEAGITLQGAVPLGEFTVMIPEPHATLQGAVTWRYQCHDRATLQGIIIPSAILKIYRLRYTWFYKRCNLLS